MLMMQNPLNLCILIYGNTHTFTERVRKNHKITARTDFGKIGLAINKSEAIIAISFHCACRIFNVSRSITATYSHDAKSFLNIIPLNPLNVSKTQFSVKKSKAFYLPRNDLTTQTRLT